MAYTCVFAGYNVSLYFEMINDQVCEPLHESRLKVCMCLPCSTRASAKHVTAVCCLHVQIQVEGIPFGNAAPIDTPDTVCSTTVYIIDEVMQPTSSLAETPGFTQLSECPTCCPIPHVPAVMSDHGSHPVTMPEW